MVFQGDDFKLDTLLYPVLLDTSEMELDEYVQAEGRVLEMGYANCLHADQLADILSNLRRQKPGYTDEDLEASINHYAEHDCFLEFEGAAGE